MENIHCQSNESLPTSDDYEFVNANSSKSVTNPELQTETSAFELERTLTEVLLESQPANPEANCKSKVLMDMNAINSLDLRREISDLNICSSVSSSSMTDGTGFCSLDNLDTEDDSGTTTQSSDDVCRMVGESKFYHTSIEKVVQSATTPLSPKEKQDYMKPTDSDEEVSDVDQECTVFSGVSYLGAATINAPKSELEIQRNMAVLSEQKESEKGIAVSVSIPTCSQGLVVLYDADSNAVMARYAVHRILFYARGAAGTSQASCFAFTWSHGDTKESAIFQCHVFKCQIAEAVSQVSSCFAKAFERVPRSMTSSLTSECTMSGSLFSVPVLPDASSTRQHILECSVEIRESDSKGGFSLVPKERIAFKLRAGIDKQVTVTVQQVPPNTRLGNEPQNMSVSQQSLPGGGLIIERCFGILLAHGRNVKHPDMQLLEMMDEGGSGATGNTSCSTTAIWNAAEPALAALNVASTEPLPIYISIGIDLVIRGMREPIRLVIETPVKIFPTNEWFWFETKKPLIQQFTINVKEKIDAHGTQYEVISLENSGIIDRIDRNRLNLPSSFSSFLPSPLTTQPAPLSPDDEISDSDEPLLSGTGEVSKECRDDVLDKWSQVLKSWTSERPKALSSLVKGGIPETLRGAVWQKLADTENNNKLMDTYRLFIAKDCPCESVIQRDIARTFPANEYFRKAGGLGQDSLFRLARTYAVYDSEIGYCQGLSFIAATLLLHMPEEQAFCVLVRLMYGYGLRDLYKDGFEVLTLRLYQLHRLMEEHLADLQIHFSNMGVEPHMFASQWFLTLFTARFPLPLVFRIMDVFLLQGMDTLFQIALALLMRSKKDLLQLDFEGILKYFRVSLPKKCRLEEVSNHIIKQACSIKVKRLIKYEQDFINLTNEASETERMSSELEQLRTRNEQLLIEKTSLYTQLSETKETLKRETEKAIADASRSTTIIQEYKDICKRLDEQLSLAKDAIKSCNTCNSKLNVEDNKKSESVDDLVIGLQQRVKELELELAQAKLAHVEALCENQQLTHQLNSGVSETTDANNQPNIANQKQSWPPWLSKTLGSLKEAAQNTRPTFHTYLSSTFVTSDIGNINMTNQQHLKRQESFPLSSVYHSEFISRRESNPDSSHCDIRNKNRSMGNRHSSVDLNYPSQTKQTNPEQKMLRKSQEVNSVITNSTVG